MKFIDVSFDTPEENLACDEVLLDMCDGEADAEILRFWQPRNAFVVVGYANKTAAEVHIDACRRDDIPILRRSTGGGAVLQAPGCLNFSLIMRIPETGPLKSISETNRFITAAHANALRSLVGDSVQAQGLSDVALGSMKISGSAQRRRRRVLLFHGTWLLDFDISRVERTLQMPSRQPEYRQNRAHSDFLTNAAATAAAVKTVLKDLWSAHDELDNLALREIESLATERYQSAEWNFRI
jgi:lipoate---protein ligase